MAQTRPTTTDIEAAIEAGVTILRCPGVPRPERVSGERMNLREKQSAFCVAIARLILWAYERGYDLTLADGNIDPIRKVRRSSTGEIVRGRDLNHMEDGLHYQRLAQDLNLFIRDEWITDGGHPAWTELGRHWTSMDSLARWGGNFEAVDSGHFSFEHEGKQ